MGRSMVWEEGLILIVLLAVIGFAFIVGGLKKNTSNEIDNNVVNETGVVENTP